MRQGNPIRDGELHSHALIVDPVQLAITFLAWTRLCGRKRSSEDEPTVRSMTD